MATTVQLAAMRAAAQALLPDGCAVERLSGMPGTWTTVGNYTCRVVPKRSVTRDGAGTLQGVTLWSVLLPWNADVRAGDRVVVGSRTYPVTGIDVGRSEPVLVVAQCGTA